MNKALLEQILEHIKERQELLGSCRGLPQKQSSCIYLTIIEDTPRRISFSLTQGGAMKLAYQALHLSVDITVIKWTYLVQLKWAMLMVLNGIKPDGTQMIWRREC